MNNKFSTTSLVSFALSILFWWLMLGSVEMAIGFLVLLFVHEMGHYIAAKYKGLAVTPPVFTPFGAAVFHAPAPSADVEAFISFAGPLFGAVSGVIALTLSVILNIPGLAILAYYAFLLNLFNMIPMKPLDGGGIAMGIHRHMWILGIPFIILSFTSGLLNNAFNMLIMIMIIMGFFQDRQYRQTLPESYFEVSFLTRVAYALAYFGLAALLFWLMTQPQDFVSFLVRIGL